MNRPHEQTPGRMRIMLILGLLCVSAKMGSAEPIRLTSEPTRLTSESTRLYRKWDVEKKVNLKHVQLIVINGNPAPTIEAQQGDTIVVQVTNGLGEDLVIVWQGIEKVHGGQCNGAEQPIPAGQTVTYCLVAKQAGEFSYQALSKLQRDAGLKGSIVVL